MGAIRLLIVGAGGHGRSVAETAQLSGKFQLVGFLDDSTPTNQPILGCPVLGSVVSMARHLNCCDQAIVAIGNNAVREVLIQQLTVVGFRLAQVIHPKAIVSPSAKLSDGIAIMSGAVVGTEASLGLGAIVNSGAVVDHHAVVEDYGHLGVGACMAGGTLLGRGAWMQAGSALGYGVKVSAGEVLKPGEAR